MIDAIFYMDVKYKDASVNFTRTLRMPAPPTPGLEMYFDHHDYEDGVGWIVKEVEYFALEACYWATIVSQDYTKCPCTIDDQCCVWDRDSEKHWISRSWDINFVNKHEFRD